MWLTASRCVSWTTCAYTAPPPGRLPAVDWAPSAAEGDKALYLFDGEQLTPEFLGRITL